MQEIDMIDGRGQGRQRMVKLAQVVGTECCHPDCEAPASASFDAKLPLCDRHYLAAYKAVMRASRIGMFTTAYDATPVVYYILQGDLIKIGFSRSLRHRMNQLRPLDILGIELGSMDLERKRHRQFQGARSHGEYFIQTPELMAHINSLALPEIPSLTVSAARDRGGLETP